MQKILTLTATLAAAGETINYCYSAHSRDISNFEGANIGPAFILIKSKPQSSVLSMIESSPYMSANMFIRQVHNNNKMFSFILKYFRQF